MLLRPVQTNWNREVTRLRKHTGESIAFTMNWDEEETLAWELVAREAQQRFSETWGSRKWEVFLQSERKLLEARVGLALFGFPEQSNADCYRKKQAKVITKVCDVIVRKTRKYAKFGQVKMSCVFVSAKSKKDRFTVPLIRVLKYDYADDMCNHRFIDTNCNVYRNWECFLKQNKLPHCLILYPTNGIYTQKDGKVLLSRGESTRRFSTAVSVVRPWGSLGVTGFGLESSRIPVSPVVAGTAMKGALFIARSVSTKRVRAKEGETAEHDTDSEQL
ncbi:uncharacterized protein LOC111869218 isoform X3 [Cryptotermes secundus]|uniref:uncharacterized protein LOC111869218 isoform X3 n=1 Tax=Cryptotermes secundus TaxID=105785 RepID=UPI001454D7F0|nr:uncharacterized protein LOC111869218 isoform X3 [Cryptotermes secundus]